MASGVDGGLCPGHGWVQVWGGIGLEDSGFVLGFVGRSLGSILALASPHGRPVLWALCSKPQPSQHMQGGNLGYLAPEQTTDVGAESDWDQRSPQPGLSAPVSIPGGALAYSCCSYTCANPASSKPKDGGGGFRSVVPWNSMHLVHVCRPWGLEP